MKHLFFCSILFLSISVQAARPKLVVGIVVDQMRYDYLTNYWNKFSEGGFKKLLTKGYNCKNTVYNYVPTYTGPGHASIYTGTTPAVHGIIANDWYDKTEHAMVYCAGDEKRGTVGTATEEGKMSPHRMLTTTISDELKIALNGKGKVIGIALKDRGAILPAGHAADAAYWFDDETGDFISSTYYLQVLPEWVRNYNARKRTDEFLKQKWTTLLPIEQYTESIADDNPFETIAMGESAPVFPHDLAAIYAKYEGYKGVVKSSPFGNILTKEMMLAAIEGEQLGKDEHTDMLCVSFSSPDYIGHAYGPKSVEVEDCYLRLDRDLEEIINYLEKNIGKENFILFLTADHAAVDVPDYLASKKIPSGHLSLSKYTDQLNNYLLEHFPLNDPSERFIRSISNNQVFLNHELLSRNKIAVQLAEEKVAEFLRTVPGVANVMTRTQLINNEYTTGIRALISNGFHEIRSGDVVVNMLPAWVDHGPKGTTHGSPYTYDTRVPLLWYGAGIPTGCTTETVNITDIAPTLSMLLQIPYPNGCTGKIIRELTK